MNIFNLNTPPYLMLFNITPAEIKLHIHIFLPHITLHQSADSGAVTAIGVRELGCNSIVHHENTTGIPEKLVRAECVRCPWVVA